MTQTLSRYSTNSLQRCRLRPIILWRRNGRAKAA
jgi:hypothetical protein